MKMETETKKPRKKVVKPEKKFSNIVDVILDPKFKEYLIAEIERLDDEFKRAENGLNTGQRLRRTTYMRMREMGMNPDSIVLIYSDIVKRDSNEPQAIRSYVINLVSQIARRVVGYYQIHEKDGTP